MYGRIDFVVLHSDNISMEIEEGSELTNVQEIKAMSALRDKLVSREFHIFIVYFCNDFIFVTRISVLRTFSNPPCHDSFSVENRSQTHTLPVGGRGKVDGCPVKILIYHQYFLS